MDPMTPPPDDSGRPGRPQDDGDRPDGDEAGVQDRLPAADGGGLIRDDPEAEAQDLAVAEDRAADDGWAAEGEPRAPEVEPRAPEAEPAAESESAVEAASAWTGTEAWRGPEAVGRTPASLEPTPNAGSAPRNESGESDESEGSHGETTGWRGPEAAGRTPASIEPGPNVESGAVTESPHADARTWEWPAADRGVPPIDDGQPSEEAGPADAEPARTGRASIGFSFFNRARSDDDAEEGAEAAAGYAPVEHLRVEERPRRLPGRRAASAALVRADPAEICPFLVAAAGGWRLAVPSREHRCGAVSPPSPLSPQKQSRLCLTEGHLRCATFLAAGAARESRVGSAAMPERVSRWALARTTPVVEEVGGVRTTLAGMLADRRRWPAIPAMLLVVALATLGLSSLRGGGAVTALATPSPQPTDVAVPTVSIAPTATVSPTPEPSPSTVPTAPPTAAPTPAPTHATYTVVSGDTLGAIAKQFGTTVQALMDLNGITDAGRLKIGQVLQIP